MRGFTDILRAESGYSSIHNILMDSFKSSRSENPDDVSSTKMSKLKKTEKVWVEKPHKVSEDVTLSVDKIKNSQTNTGR